MVDWHGGPDPASLASYGKTAEDLAWEEQTRIKWGSAPSATEKLSSNQYMINQGHKSYTTSYPVDRFLYDRQKMAEYVTGVAGSGIYPSNTQWGQQELVYKANAIPNNASAVSQIKKTGTKGWYVITVPVPSPYFPYLEVLSWGPGSSDNPGVPLESVIGNNEVIKTDVDSGAMSWKKPEGYVEKDMESKYSGLDPRLMSLKITPESDSQEAGTSVGMGLIFQPKAESSKSNSNADNSSSSFTPTSNPIFLEWQSLNKNQIIGQGPQGQPYYGGYTIHPVNLDPSHNILNPNNLPKAHKRSFSRKKMKSHRTIKNIVG